VAVHGLELAIESGEVFGLLGPNGSGKTTTLRMLATLIAPSSGSAAIMGHPIATEAMAIRRLIGVMPEKPGLYERLTVDDNLRFWAEAHSLPDPAAAVGEALALVGIADRRTEKVASLSKGLRQRVALARAVIHRPPVLLLDEPSSGLDPSAAAEMEAMIRGLASDGAAVLMNTHRLAEAERLCDRVGILRSGHLLALGTPREIRARLLGQAVEVVFEGSASPSVRLAAESLPLINSVEWRRDSLRCRLGDARRDTPELVSRVVAAGGRVLEVRQAGDLEAAYLELMARPLQEAA
jgi:ABC-2 type transport system ATP-binding protein